MQRFQETSGRDLAVLAIAVSLLVLASPLRSFWMQDGTHWLVPFGVWAGVIAMGALAARKDRP